MPRTPDTRIQTTQKKKQQAFMRLTSKAEKLSRHQTFSKLKEADLPRIAIQEREVRGAFCERQRTERFLSSPGSAASVFWR